MRSVLQHKHGNIEDNAKPPRGMTDPGTHRTFFFVKTTVKPKSTVRTHALLSWRDMLAARHSRHNAARTPPARPVAIGSARPHRYHSHVGGACTPYEKVVEVLRYETRLRCPQPLRGLETNVWRLMSSLAVALLTQLYRSFNSQRNRPRLPLPPRRAWRTAGYHIIQPKTKFII